MNELLRDIEKCQKKAEEERLKREALTNVEPNKKCWECNRLDVSDIKAVYHNGKTLYIVAHMPIDETMGIDGKWSVPMEDRYWGLEKAFENITDTDLGNELKFLFYSDEPAFVGRCVVPVTTDYELKAVYLYVVRCINNGTTYFVSEEQSALRAFVM